MNTTIIIPAHNEEPGIERAINLIRRSGVQAKILVINDGSTDKTAAIVKRMGVELVNLPKNKGKAYAVFTGIRAVAPEKPDVVLIMDGDLVKINGHATQELIRLTSQHKDVPVMDIAVQKEADGSLLLRDSGFRGFNGKAVELLSKIRLSRFEISHIDTGTKGYFLEDFLNFYFRDFLGKKAIVRQFGGRRQVAFETQKAFRARQGPKQEKTLIDVLQRMMKEMQIAGTQQAEKEEARAKYSALAKKIKARANRSRLKRI